MPGIIVPLSPSAGNRNETHDVARAAHLWPRSPLRQFALTCDTLALRERGTMWITARRAMTCFQPRETTQRIKLAPPSHPAGLFFLAADPHQRMILSGGCPQPRGDMAHPNARRIALIVRHLSPVRRRGFS